MVASHLSSGLQLSVNKHVLPYWVLPSGLLLTGNQHPDSSHSLMLVVDQRAWLLCVWTSPKDVEESVQHNGWPPNSKQCMRGNTWHELSCSLPVADLLISELLFVQSRVCTPYPQFLPSHQAMIWASLLWGKG